MQTTENDREKTKQKETPESGKKGRRRRQSVAGTSPERRQSVATERRQSDAREKQKHKKPLPRLWMGQMLAERFSMCEAGSVEKLSVVAEPGPENRHTNKNPEAPFALSFRLKPTR